MTRPDTSLTAHPRDVWPAIVRETCQAAGFSLEPGDAEDIIERMGPPYKLSRVLKRARGLAFVRSATVELMPEVRRGSKRDEAFKRLGWSAAAAEAARQQSWEADFSRKAQRAQKLREMQEVLAQEARAKAQEKAAARALAKTLPRIQDPQMLERVGALPVSLAGLLHPAEVSALSDADAVARLAEYRRILKGLVAGRAAGKGLVANRKYLMDRLRRPFADDLCRWELDLARRVREILARERANRPPPAPKAVRKSTAKHAWLLDNPYGSGHEAQPIRPWGLRGVELDNVLSISAAERRRWIQEGRVPAIGHYEGRMPNGIRYYGTLHDPKVIRALKPCIPEWRAERKAQLAEARRERNRKRYRG